MPERYTLTRTAEQLHDKLKVEVPEDYRPRFNAAPAQLLPVITSAMPGGLSWFFWGTIPGWSGNRSISSRIITIEREQLFSKPMYKSALDGFRCAIPADGFYVWKKLGKKTRIPYRVELQDKSLFCFAGLWEGFEDENDQVHHVFKIIVDSSPGDSRDFEGTFPLILRDELISEWLEPGKEADALAAILNKSKGHALHQYTVSSKIEDINADHEGLIQEVDSMNQFGNYSLFD